MSSKGRSGIKLRAGAADAVDAGEVFFVPAETVHAVRNVGGGSACQARPRLREFGFR
jgi:quercetin dioxygenase-like cupin family protein